MDSQFDMIIGLEAKNGYQSDSSAQGFKIFLQERACPQTLLDGHTLAYLSKLTLQKAHVFSDPRPSINPLPVVITRMNGLIVRIGFLQ